MIRTGSDSIFADQDWTRTKKFHSPLISVTDHRPEMNGFSFFAIPQSNFKFQTKFKSDELTVAKSKSRSNPNSYQSCSTKDKITPAQQLPHDQGLREGGTRGILYLGPVDAGARELKVGEMWDLCPGWAQ